MAYLNTRPCVECGVATRADRMRCPACQRLANWRFFWVSVLVVVVLVLWSLMR